MAIFLKVDLYYPEELHESHDDFPTAPEKIKKRGCHVITILFRNKKRI